MTTQCQHLQHNIWTPTGQEPLCARPAIPPRPQMNARTEALRDRRLESASTCSTDRSTKNTISGLVASLKDKAEHEESCVLFVFSTRRYWLSPDTQSMMCTISSRLHRKYNGKRHPRQNKDRNDKYAASSLSSSPSSARSLLKYQQSH